MLVHMTTKNDKTLLPLVKSYHKKQCFLPHFFLTRWGKNEHNCFSTRSCFFTPTDYYLQFLLN